MCNDSPCCQKPEKLKGKPEECTTEQITECRYRPLNQTYDNYKASKKQKGDDYYIHPKWLDDQVKQFRRNIRRQNICVRHRFEFYSNEI